MQGAHAGVGLVGGCVGGWQQVVCAVVGGVEGGSRSPAEQHACILHACSKPLPTSRPRLADPFSPSLLAPSHLARALYSTPGACNRTAAYNSGSTRAATATRCRSVRLISTVASWGKRGAGRCGGGRGGCQHVVPAHPLHLQPHTCCNGQRPSVLARSLRPKPRPPHLSRRLAGRPHDLGRLVVTCWRERVEVRELGRRGAGRLHTRGRYGMLGQGRTNTAA